MDSAPRVSGCILAGGTGSRVGGADKGLLPLCGRPLIEHALDGLRGQCDALLIVANRNLETYSRYAATIGDGREGHAGPLAGVAAALAHVAPSESSFRRKPGCRLLLTAPVDCPSPPHDLRERLQSALMKFDDAACAFVRDDTDAQTLFALYRLSRIDTLLVSARAALHSHASVRRWHEDLGARAVDFSDRSPAFHNLNTPQDF